MKPHVIISVWNKHGVTDLARALIDKGYRILSTGGTHKTIAQALDDATRLVEVSDFTGYQELLGGRVKTLHPKIHAGILARDDQLPELEENELVKIQMVIVNLYPFQETVASGADNAAVLENIDIGGHTLIRAAAKNYQNTLVVCDPADYQRIADGLDCVTLEDRRAFAAKAFAHATEYDIAVSRYFGDQTVRKYYPVQQLKYGCNPHQEYAALCGINVNETPLKILNGETGYINLIDALLGFQLVCEAARTLGHPTAASYKHTSPAGVGTSQPPLRDIERVVFDVGGWELTPVSTAFTRARNCDPLSSFGDFISISHVVDVSTAKLIKREVSDGIIAPGYMPEALEILRTKKSGRYTILQLDSEWCRTAGGREYREIAGMALCQAPNTASTGIEDLTNIPTRLRYIPTQSQQDLILANITLKYTQSNSVAYSYCGQVIGIGAGQQNRVDCVKLAGSKAHRWCARFTEAVLIKKETLTGTRSEQNNALYEYLDSREWSRTNFPLSLASDAFFPFPDSIKVASGFGVEYILQPGGSMGDKACIEECDREGIVMAMSNKRMFLH